MPTVLGTLLQLPVAVEAVAVAVASLLQMLLGAELLALEGGMEVAVDRAVLLVSIPVRAFLIVIPRPEPLADRALCAYCGRVTRAHSLLPMLVRHKEQ